MKIEQCSKHTYTITDWFNTNFHTIISSKFNIPIKVPILNHDISTVYVKELYLDIGSGNVFFDDTGTKHQIDVLSCKKKHAKVRTERINDIEFNFYTNVICTDVGVLYYADTGKPVKMSDSNGLLRYKESLVIKGTKKGVSVNPIELCLEAFKDDKEAVKKIKNIWYKNGKQLHFVFKSPFNMDSKRASTKPIICTDTGECIFNERQYAFAITGIPNRGRKYPKNLIIDNHQYREVSEEELEDIFDSYYNYRHNAPKEITENRCYYNRRKGNKREVITIRDSLINLETI